MNPGKVVDAVPARREPAPRRRTTARAGARDAASRSPDDGGELRRAAAERCVGVGKCRARRRRDDVPELHGRPARSAHSTRGRARLLFEMLQGDARPRRLAQRRRPARRSTCAWRARAARATARSTSTWPRTRPSSCRTTTTAALPAAGDATPSACCRGPRARWRGAHLAAQRRAPDARAWRRRCRPRSA